jgi:transposase
VARSYRPVLRDQPLLLPVDMRDWLPGDHLVWFVIEVVGELDLSALHARRRLGGAGRSAYDPQMLLTLLVYAYGQGVRSSRQVERLCEVDVAYRVICAGDIPDHATLARFRAEHEAAFAGLFAQVLAVAARAGLGRFATVAIDGTKISADASLDANRNRDSVIAEAERVQAERVQAERILAEAAAVDAREDGEYGRERGDELPPDLRDPRKRRARIVAAAAEARAQRDAERKAEQQARARDRAERERAEEERLQRLREGQAHAGSSRDPARRVAEARARLERERARQQARLDERAGRVAAGRRVSRHPMSAVEDYIRVREARAALARAEHAAEHAGVRGEPAHNDGPGPGRGAGGVRGRAVTGSGGLLPGPVTNLTDPQSRIMPVRRGGWVQGYNAQIAATADQLIVAVGLGQSPSDQPQAIPMMQAVVAAANACHAAAADPGADADGQHDIGVLLFDAGYHSHANLTAPGPDRLIAVGKARALARDARDHPAHGDPPTDADPSAVMHHRLRTPAGAALYKRRGATVEPAIGNLKKILDRFSRRGLDAARSELHLAAAVFNLKKIHAAAAA